MEKTFHLVSALIVVEQREQGDQLVARDIVEHMLAAACAAETRRRRRVINVKSTVLESMRIVDPSTSSGQVDDVPAPKEQNEH